MSLIDVHCHLDAPAYHDVETVCRQSHQAGVEEIVAVGTGYLSNERILALQQHYPGQVLAALGLHPERLDTSWQELEAVVDQVRQHRCQVMALGEIGLPHYALRGQRMTPEQARQHETFLHALIKHAVQLGLPVALHAPHDAAHVALQIVQRYQPPSAMFHWHKSDPAITAAICEAGYFISVTPEICYRERDQELVRTTPLGNLLLETDGPWPYHGEFDGQRTTSALVLRVAEEVARLKKMSLADVQEITTANARCWLGQI
ncbi:MAG: TatD family hydrolase [bacterium]|nr:TatD family hydrolase [bacterium]